MGDFKHQSIRSNEREKYKDADRDLRDKEGQERLRSVSPQLSHLSPLNPIRGFLINTTGIACRLLLAVR